MANQPLVNAKASATLRSQGPQRCCHRVKLLSLTSAEAQQPRSPEVAGLFGHLLGMHKGSPGHGAGDQAAAELQGRTLARALLPQQDQHQPEIGANERMEQAGLQATMGPPVDRGGDAVNAAAVAARGIAAARARRL